MANHRNRRKEAAAPSVFDQARDELFQHIMRCGVIGAEAQHQAEWFDDTMPYIADRYHELSEAQLAELRTLAERFVQPPKSAPAANDDAISAA